MAGPGEAIAVAEPGRPAEVAGRDQRERPRDAAGDIVPMRIAPLGPARAHGVGGAAAAPVGTIVCRVVVAPPASTSSRKKPNGLCSHRT